MALPRNLNQPLRIAYVAIGVLMVMYALVAHLILPGIPFALLIIGGLLLILEGAAGF